MDYRPQAARHALQYVQDGMLLGLGSGTTAAYFIDALGEKVRSGEMQHILGVPTSEASAARARSWGIPLTTLAAHQLLDLVVDGADEVDPNLNLIKGLGRALLREKIVEIHTRRLVIVADESKLTPRLGRGPLPLEILPFEWPVHIRWLNTLGCRAALRFEADGSPVITDNGTYQALCSFPDGIQDPYALADQLAQRPGIVEHGLFLDMVDEVVVADADGIRTLVRR